MKDVFESGRIVLYAITLILLAVLLMVTQSGCSMFASPPSLNKVTDLNLDKNAEDIKESATTIRREAKCQKVKDEASKLFSIANILMDKHELFKAFQKLTEKLQKKVEDFESGKQTRLDNMFLSFILAGLCGAVLGIFLIVGSTSFGLWNLAGLGWQCIIFGSLVSLLAGVGYFYFKIGVILCAICILVLLVYFIFKRVKDGNLLLETNRTIEVYKNFTNKEDADKAASIIQSPSTQKTLGKVNKKDNNLNLSRGSNAAVSQ